MKQLGEKGCYTVSEEIKAKLQADFYGGFCDEAKTSAIIAQVWKEHHYLIDPHTAVAYGVMQDYRERPGMTGRRCLSPPPAPLSSVTAYSTAWALPRCGRAWAPWISWRRSPAGPPPVPLASLRDKAVRFEESVDKEKMMDVVLDMLR